MRKVDDGEERNKRMLFIVATDIVASQPPYRRPTGTRHARAKKNVVYSGHYRRCQLTARTPTARANWDKRSTFNLYYLINQNQLITL